jgi:hypothetical protein
MVHLKKEESLVHCKLVPYDYFGVFLEFIYYPAMNATVLTIDMHIVVDIYAFCQELQ